MERDYFKIDSKAQNDCIVANLYGHADLANASSMKEQLEDLAKGNEKTILVDCSELVFITSSGLREFLRFARQISAEEKSLKFFSLNEDVAKIFEVSGFDKILEVYPDRKTALASL